MAEPLTHSEVDALHRIVDGFRRFAQQEGEGYAPLYEQLAALIALDPQLASPLLVAAPEQRRHTLYLAALHYLVLEHPDHELSAWYPTVAPSPRRDDPSHALRSFCEDYSRELREIVASHATQTNEIGRGAVLHPAISWALAKADEPLCLIDLGCSAGLNLLLDRWRYEYTGGAIRGDEASPVRFACELRGGQPLPASVLPGITSRLGIDLAPIDLRDPRQTRWLQACVFADHPDRFRRLTTALALARNRPPEIVAGDILDALPAVLERLRREARGSLCITSTWSLAYLSLQRREELFDLLREQGRSSAIHLIMGEPCDVALAEISGEIPGEGTVWSHTCYSAGGAEQTLLACSHPHGSWLEWLV